MIHLIRVKNPDFFCLKFSAKNQYFYLIKTTLMILKKLTFFCLLFFGMIFLSAQNFELSTLRMGDFTINMKDKTVEKIAKTKLPAFNGDNYFRSMKAEYFGQPLEINVLQGVTENGEYALESTIYSLNTKSKKFRTKSGMGVGSTKAQLLEAYRNFPNLKVAQVYEDQTDSFSKINCNFILQDFEAGTALNFTLKNNIVVEVTVYVNEGC